MNINEHFKNKVKIIGKKVIHKISHILAAMYLRPMNMVGLSSDVSHMQIIQVVCK